MKKHVLARDAAHKNAAQKVAAERFFDEVEEMIVQRMHREAESEQGREELVCRLGVDDPRLTDELVRLGITADGVAALRFIPLVLVAWAEGKAENPEREAVMAEALCLGIREGTCAWVLLDTWLKKRPPGLVVDAWKRHLHDIFVRMSNIAIDRLIKRTESQMTKVAKASGGHFGLGRVSKKERIIIDRIAKEMGRAAVAINRAGE